MPQVQKKVKYSQDESFFDDANLEQEIKRDYVSLLFDAETFQKSEVLEYLDEWMANPPAGFRRNKPLYDVQPNPNGLTIMFENYKAGRKFYNDLWNHSAIVRRFGNMRMILEPVDDISFEPATLHFENYNELFDAEGIDEHLYLPYENYKSEQRMSRTMGENTVLTPPPAEIKDLMDAFEEQGYEILVVGGAVRDAILNLPIKDYDLATNAKPDEIKEVVDGIKGYRYVLGPQAEKSLVNLTSLVNVPNQKEAIEITTFRKELGYAGGRTKGVFEPADTFEEDAERRDLTINAMGMNSKGEVIDPQGGLEDLQNGVIRAVGDPTQRFVEDPLRMIRAIRFSVRFGLPIDEETYQAIVSNADLVSTLSGRRLRDEIGKVLVEPNGYKLLMETGILPVLMPEFRGMEQYQHKLDYHPEGSLYNHYMEVFREFTTIPNRTELGAWALLFHDIAKPQTAEWNEEGGYHTFYGHDKQGSQLILENYNNESGPFEFSKKELQAIAWVAEHHLGKFWETKKPMKVSAMRNNENFPLLVQVIGGDTMGIRRGGNDQLQARLKEINEITDKVNAQKAKTGNRPKDFARKVIQQLNVQGKDISIALDEIEEMVSTGQVASYDEALEVLKTKRNA